MAKNNHQKGSKATRNSWNINKCTSETKQPTDRHKHRDRESCACDLKVAYTCSKLTFSAVVPACFFVRRGARASAASVAFETLTFAALFILRNPFLRGTSHTFHLVEGWLSSAYWTTICTPRVHTTSRKWPVEGMWLEWKVVKGGSKMAKSLISVISWIFVMVLGISHSMSIFISKFWGIQIRSHKYQITILLDNLGRGRRWWPHAKYHFLYP